MELKKLKATQERLAWPSDSSDLPVISWESCTFNVFILPVRRLKYLFVVQEQATKRPLILISGFIHDVSTFIDEHPGGPHLLVKFIGKDATTAFFGGVYDHSNAAHNVCSVRCLLFTFFNMLHCFSCSLWSVSVYSTEECDKDWTTNLFLPVSGWRLHDTTSCHRITAVQLIRMARVCSVNQPSSFLMPFVVCCSRFLSYF